MKYGDLIQNEGIYEVRAGFKKAWQEHDYATIIAVAEKIPETVLQEDPKLLMWYDQGQPAARMVRPKSPSCRAPS